MKPTPLLFHETQRFDQLWLWVPLLGLMAFFLWGIFQQIVLGRPWGDNPASDIGLLLFSLIPLGIVFLLRSIQLETRISEEEIDANLSPFARTRIRWEDVARAEVITYGFVGFGLRLSARYGTVYNIKGNKGMLVELKDGKKRLIGTQKPKELQQVIDNCMGGQE